MDAEIIKSLLIAVVLGFAIGLQRTMAQLYQQEKEGGIASSVAGSRTFALIALLGFMSGWLSEYTPQIITLIGFALVIFLGLSYHIKTMLYKKMGMTTQIAALVTYLLGVMIALHLEQYAIFVGVLMIVLLEIKPRLKKIEENISPSDLSATTLLLAMTFLILPILPDRMVDPYHLFNPYKTWMMAVLIAAISFVGYVAIKALGSRLGVLLTGLFGGLVSSTAVTITLSKISTTQKESLNHYAAGIAMASTLMYLRVLLETFIISPEVAKVLVLPYLGASLSGLIFVILLYRQPSGASLEMHADPIAANPLQFSEAVKFGLLFGVIYGVINLVRDYYGDIGVYVISLLSGLTEVDALTLSLSELASNQKLSIEVASMGIVIASVTNSLVKLGIVFWLGGSALGWRIALFFLITLGMLGGGVWAEQILT